MIFLLYTVTSALIVYISNIQRTEKYSAVMYYLSPDQFLVVIINASLGYLIYYGQAHFERTFQDFSQQGSDLRVAMCSGIFSWRRFDRRRLFSLLVGFPQSSCSSLPLSFREFRRRIPFRKKWAIFLCLSPLGDPSTFSKNKLAGTLLWSWTVSESCTSLYLQL